MFKVMFFWDKTPYTLADSYQHFERTRGLHLQDTTSEDGHSTFLPDAGTCTPNYTA
jgi:hypothetical protein